MPSYQTEITLGFSINWQHESLQLFPYMTPEAEESLRESFFDMLFGDKATEFRTLLVSPEFNPEPIITNGYLGGVEAHEWASLAVTKFNELEGMTQLATPADEPHCVTYYWINGELVVIYHYEADESADHGHMPEGGTLHVVVRVTHVPIADAEAL